MVVVAVMEVVVVAVMEVVVVAAAVVKMTRTQLILSRMVTML